MFVPVRPESVAMEPDATVAVITPEVLPSMMFASATETVPDREIASSPRPEKLEEA